MVTMLYVELALLRQWLFFAAAPGYHLQQKALASKDCFQA